MKYTGLLVLYGDDGSIDRQAITITMPSASPESGLNPQYNPEITRQTSYTGISILSGWFPGRIQPVNIPLADEYAGSDRMVGLLSGSGQVFIPVWQHGASLVITDLPQAGTYSGVLDLRPLQPGTAIVKLTVQARDVCCGPLIVLILGLMLAYSLDRTFRVCLPRTRLELKLEEGIESAKSRQTKASTEKSKFITQNNSLLPSGWVDAGVFRIVDEKQPTGEPGLLCCARDHIMKEFSQAQSDDLRAKWGPNGSEVEKALGYLDNLDGINHLSLMFLKEYIELIRNPVFQQKVESIGPDQIPLLASVFKSLKPCLFVTGEELQQRQERLKEALALLQDYRVTFIRIANRIKSLDGEGALPYKRILDRMVFKEMANLPDLILQKEIFQALELKSGSETLIRGTKDLLEGGQRAGIKQDIYTYVIRSLPSIKPVEVMAEKTSEKLRHDLRCSEILYWLLSSAIVLLVGMQTLYVSNPTFGTWTDYLNVFLWGVVVNEGVRLGRSIVPQISRMRSK